MAYQLAYAKDTIKELQDDLAKERTVVRNLHTLVHDIGQASRKPSHKEKMKFVNSQSGDVNTK